MVGAYRRPPWLTGIYHPRPAAVDLGGWCLGFDRAAAGPRACRWRLPAGGAAAVPAGGRLVIFAVGEAAAAVAPPGALQAPFKLDKDGVPWLGLRGPDGGLVAEATLGAQVPDVSYGVVDRDLEGQRGPVS